MLFDVLPDDRLTPSQRATYRAVLEVNGACGRAGGPESIHSAGTRARIRQPTWRPTRSRLHFVNYNREEPKAKRSPGAGIKDEKPIAVEGVSADLVLPERSRVVRVLATTPESRQAVELKHTVKSGRVQFTLPKFLVYAVVRVQTEKER